MRVNVEYRDIIIKPIRKGGKPRRMRVSTEVRPIGQVRIGNKVLWEGTVNVITPERR